MFVALIAKLIYIEVVSADSLQARALEQWMRDVPLQAERGEIYDRNGILIADSSTTYTLYIRPNACKNKNETAKIVSDAIGFSYENVRAKLDGRISEFTLKKNVSKQTMLNICATAATGVYFGQNISRIYPYGDFMSQVLGFTNIDCVGQTGLELKYNQYLAGRDGYILTETDLVGRELSTNNTKYIAGAVGNTAKLTVDYYIQAFAENAVKSALSKYSAKRASCMVMDINTGEVMALAEAPSFDLNNIPRDNVAELLTNSKISMISNVFEPGSTFKIITAGTGLETGAVTRQTKCFCSGSHIVDGKKIKCWRTIGHGSQTFDQGVQNSCNVLFMNTALNIGAKRFYSKIRELGLTSKSGIDIIGEGSGLVIPEASVKNVDLARIGFGQAIAITPIELLRAASAVINGGNLVTPYIVDSFTNGNGDEVFKNYPNIKNGVISDKVSADMREILESVVEVGGGKNAKVAGYRIGGKTGTAQKYENGIIARGKYVATFIGFTPADNPKYIALMVVDEPQGAYYGSVVSAPYVGDLFAKIFSYKGIPPTTAAVKPMFEMPDLVGLSIMEAAKILKDKKLYYEIDGEEGVVTGQIPVAGSLITEDTVTIIIL